MSAFRQPEQEKNMKSLIKQHKTGLIITMIIGLIAGYSAVNLFLDIVLGGSMF